MLTFSFSYGPVAAVFFFLPFLPPPTEVFAKTTLAFPSEGSTNDVYFELLLLDFPLSFLPEEPFKLYF